MSRIQGDLEFSKNWENDEDFPTREYNEAVVRENIQLLFDETKDYINDIVTPAVNDNAESIAALGGGGTITHAQLGDEIVESNNIKNQAITEYKYGATSIPTSAFKNGSITAEKLHTATVNPYIAQRINAYPDATTSAHGLMSTSDKTKLNGIATGAEVNQNAFSNVAVGSTTIAADGKTDTLTLAAGANVTLTPDATTDKITIASANTTYSAATTSAAGLMSAADKTKLNGIATGAEVNQNAFSNVAVGSTTIAADGKTDTLTLVAGSNVTLTPDATNDKITIASTNTTYSVATTSAAGLMSAADKTKLNGIATGANAYSLPTASSSTLGGVKTGSNITNSSGTISVSSSNVAGALGFTPMANLKRQNGVGYVNGIAGGLEIGVDFNFDSNHKKDQAWVYMDCATTASQNRSAEIEVHGDVYPDINNTWSLGYSSYAWDQVYAYGFNNKSDRRQKKDIDYDMSKYLTFFDSLRPCSFRYVDKDKDKHTGIVAQDVVEALTDIGATDSAIVNADTDDGMLNIRYTEFIGILIAKVQDLQRQVDELKAGGN